MVDTNEKTYYWVLDWDDPSNKSTKDVFADSMREIAQRSELHRDDPMYIDRESAHVVADQYMCQVLRDLGFNEGVDIFESMPKWYA